MSDGADEIARETIHKLTVPGCVADIAIIAAALRAYAAEVEAERDEWKIACEFYEAERNRLKAEAGK